MRLRRRVRLRHHLRVNAQDVAALAADARAATERYLASVPPEARARSDAYFEGGYWIQLWGFLITAGILFLLLHTGWSRRMRDVAERATRRRALQDAIYWALFFAITTVAAFPFTVYAGFIREHQYGLATQAFGPWMGDQAKGFAIGLILGAVAIMALYAILRRFTRSWWIWGAVFLVVLQIIGATIFPVFIAPVFNTYTRLEDPAVRDPILSLAHANGIDAAEVWQVDASRQTTRISANVSGMFGTERITLNDNLLNRCSQACIEAVMGHEMGHYVLNHVYELLLAFGAVIVVGFAVMQYGFDRLRTRHAARWGIAGIGDPAGLPLLMLILTAYMFVLTPLLNTIIRTNEYEADVFGINASRQPDGFAEAALKLGEYRKLEPSPWEERLFFDHPSGRTRIFTAMRWKLEQAPDRTRGSARATAPPPRP